jgi:hypothetical protein
LIDVTTLTLVSYLVKMVFSIRGMIEISEVAKKEKTLAKGTNLVGIDHDRTHVPNVIFTVTIIILPYHVLYFFRVLVFLLEKIL